MPVGDAYRRHLGVALGRLGNLLGGRCEDASTGAEIICVDGRLYLDCGSYGTNFVGTHRTEVEERVIAQIHRRPLATRALLDPGLAAAATSLAGVLPDGLDRVYLSPSGTDAVEVALKLALACGRHHVIAAEGAFHGKTLGALALTDNPTYSSLFDTRLSGVTRVAFDDEGDVRRALAEVESKSAVVIVEPVQSERGVRIPGPQYLAEVARACHSAGALLVVDEIMTGLGRCGAWSLSARAGITPDIILLGKGLSGGVVPVAATVATAEAFASLGRDPYLHTSTFGGAPLQAAAVSATVDVVAQHGLVEASAARGAQLLTRLRAVAAEHPRPDVRGVGLLIALDFGDPALAGEAFLALLDEGVLVITRSIVVRFSGSPRPPRSTTSRLSGSLRQCGERSHTSRGRHHAHTRDRRHRGRGPTGVGGARRSRHDHGDPQSGARYAGRARRHHVAPHWDLPRRCPPARR
ncbi:aspartate aminotransferase family protein [Tsukamurella serpentis]